MKLPAFQFYPADWRKDPGVQSLSYHDRGVWFEILCLMHESEQRGRLLLNGKPMPDEALARLLGLDKQILTKTLTTILSYGVASRALDGALVNRRMVRDDELRKLRREVGKLGGNPALLNQTSNQNGEPDLSKVQPLQSSSSSSKHIGEKKSRSSPPPSTFPITSALEKWAAKEAPGIDLRLETDNFLDHHRAKDSRFRDWVAAWRTWMRNAATKYAPRNGTSGLSPPKLGVIAPDCPDCNDDGQKEVTINGRKALTKCTHGVKHERVA